MVAIASPSSVASSGVVAPVYATRRPRVAPPPTPRNARRIPIHRASREGSEETPRGVGSIAERDASTSARTRGAVASDRASMANADASLAWERFYQTHSGSSRGRKGQKTIAAFKDRHYLRKEFTELMPSEVLADPNAWPEAINPETTRPPERNSKDHKVVLELGCGVGNSAFPLLRANLDLEIIAVDCSATAVAALTRNPEFDPRRCKAFCADLGSLDAPLSESNIGEANGIADQTIDAVTGVFFFSALDASGFTRVVNECARVLKPGGVVLFRDYAEDDVKNNDNDAHSRTGALAFQPGEKIDDATYVRGDGTLAIFTDEETVAKKFQSAGFRGKCRRVTHVVTNRKLGVSLERHFVQGRFVKPE